MVYKILKRGGVKNVPHLGAAHILEKGKAPLKAKSFYSHLKEQFNCHLKKNPPLHLQEYNSQKISLRIYQAKNLVA